MRLCVAGAFACALLSFPLSAQTIQRAEALWKAHDYIGATAAFDALRRRPILKVPRTGVRSENSSPNATVLKTPPSSSANPRNRSEERHAHCWAGMAEVTRR